MKTVDERRQRLSEISRRGIAVPSAAHIAVEEAVPPASLREWPWWAHVWDRPTRTTWTQNPSMLEYVQEEWDKGEGFVSTQNELRAEREARNAEAQSEADATDAARRQVDADQLKAKLRDQYLSLPGTSEQDFERDYPQLLQDERRRELDRLDRLGDDATLELRRVVRNVF